MRNEARSQLHNFVHIVDMENVFKVHKAVVHLNGTLRVANVEDLVFSGDRLDSRDVGRVIVKTHVCPCPVPVLTISRAVECDVVPTVHGSTVVSDPHVISSINEKKVEWSTIEVLHH